MHHSGTFLPREREVAPSAVMPRLERRDDTEWLFDI